MLRFLGLPLVLFCLIPAAACDNNLEKVKNITDDVCACKDMACVEGVAKRAEAEIPSDVFRDLMKREPEAVMRQVERVGKCIQELMGDADIPLELPFASPGEIPDIPKLH